MLPTLGILVFIILFGYASILYPGGSQANMNSLGFDWIHNYWCNLMNEKAINTQINPARNTAVTALVILCISLALFFIQFARVVVKSVIRKRIIQVFGVLSMFFAALIFTKYHDLMTIVSSVFGVFVVIGIIWEVFKSNLKLFKYGGIVSILLLILNNYIYYSGNLIAYLPLLQKITFLIVLCWIIGLNLKLSKI